MLSIPLKRTEHTIDLKGPIRRYLIKEFSEEDAKRYEEDLEIFQGLRVNAVIVEAATTAGIAALQHYYAQVSKLEPIFPVSETQVQVGFRWGDAFNPSKKSAQSTLHFERVCVLYNLGALQSHLGAGADRSSDEGLKAACRHFQQAAGIFQYIKDTLSKQLIGALTPDLVPDGLSCVTTLMLAQAQACFYEKAVRDRSKTNMKAALVSKLAAQASEFYRQALEFITAPNLAPNIDRSWAGHVDFQHKAFNAAGHYWAAVAQHELADERASGYGEEIARLSLAEEAVNVTLKSGQKNGISVTFTNSVETLKNNIAKNKAARLKENQTIYFESVPAPQSLAPLSLACMVKPLEPPPAALPANAPKLFDGLLPKRAKVALEAYRHRAVDMLKEVDAKVKETDKLARSELAQVGLPGTLEAHESKEGVPDSVWNKLVSTRERTGGLDSLRDKVSEVEGSAERARGMIEAVDRTLREEDRRDDDFRKRYTMYEGVKSTQLSTDLRKDVEHYRELWRQARESDAKIMHRLEDPDTREDLENLGLSRGEIDARMPQRAAGAESAPRADTAQLSAKLMELAALITERGELFTRLAEQANKEDISHTLMAAAAASSSPDSAYDEAVEAAVAGYQPMRAQVEANLSRQPNLLEQIMAENHKFEQARASDPATVARERFLQRINHGVSTYHEAHAQLSEGAMFYADLLRRLAQLNQTCEDLVYTQSLQRREYEVQYTHTQELARQQADDEELARKMAAEGNVAPSQQQQPQPGAPPQSGGGYPGGGYPGFAGQYHPSPQQHGGGYVQQQYPPNPYTPRDSQYNPYQQQQQQQQQQQHHQQYPGYGAPPPSGGGYGSPAAPPQNQYGAPDHQGYGGGYGAGYGQGLPSVSSSYPTVAPTAGYGGPSQPQGQGQGQGQHRPLPSLPPRSQNPGAGSSAQDPKVRRLADMGFPIDKVQAALQATNGDENAAVTRLLADA